MFGRKIVLDGRIGNVEPQVLNDGREVLRIALYTRSLIKKNVGNGSGDEDAIVNVTVWEEIETLKSILKKGQRLSVGVVKIEAVTQIKDEKPVVYFNASATDIGFPVNSNRPKKNDATGESNEGRSNGSSGTNQQQTAEDNQQGSSEQADGKQDGMISIDEVDDFF